MPYVREGDVENPAIAKLGKRQKKASDDPYYDQDDSRCNCRFLKAGWFWAVVIVVTTICIAAPIGVRTTRSLNAPVTDPPKYKFNGTGLNTTVPEALDPTWLLNPNETLTCDMVASDMPTAAVPVGKPAPPVKLLGDKLVTADGGKEVQIHGVNWFGFNNGKTMVDGLDGEGMDAHTWEGGDFAHIVYQLRLLGFNTVRLPFLFRDVLGMSPQKYTKPCPDKLPSIADLAARTTNPAATVPANAPVPYPFLAPTGLTPGQCNSYVPNDGTVLGRYLWTVQYFVANGFYVVIDYHPHGREVEPEILQLSDNFVGAWLRVWKALTCLPNFEKDIKGRALLDLMNEPDGVEIAWGSNELSPYPPLEDYYLGVMDAINKHSPAEAIFIIEGGGQDKLGSSWGDGFVTDPKLIKERNMADANNFFTQLSSRPYKGQVALGPHMYSGSISKSNDVGKAQWDKYAASWGYLQETGYCTKGDACQKFPVIIGETGSNFSTPHDEEYFADMVKFMQKMPPADEYPSTKFNNWIWWAYNANSGDTGGLVKDDWQTLDWQKLGWMQQNLGLTPWYQQQQQQPAAVGATAAAVAVAAEKAAAGSAAGAAGAAGATAQQP